MTTIYSVSDGVTERPFYSLSLKQATKEARDLADANGFEIDVDAQELCQLPSVGLVIRILNRGGWAKNVRKVLTVRPGKFKGKDDNG